jgi:hypothetical protein
MEFNMISAIRSFFAPVILRFQDTEGLKETLDFLGMVDHGKLDSKLARWTRRTERLIANELIRRGIRIWEF